MKKAACICIVMVVMIFQVNAKNYGDTDYYLNTKAPWWTKQSGYPNLKRDFHVQHLNTLRDFTLPKNHFSHMFSANPTKKDEQKCTASVCINITSPKFSYRDGNYAELWRYLESNKNRVVKKTDIINLLDGDYPLLTKKDGNWEKKEEDKWDKEACLRDAAIEHSAYLHGHSFMAGGAGLACASTGPLAVGCAISVGGIYAYQLHKNDERHHNTIYYCGTDFQESAN